MRVQHIEVSLVHCDIGRLADCAPGMMKPLTHIPQFYEVSEILNGGVTPPAFCIPNEWRTVNRSKHQVFATDLNISFRIAGMLGEL